MATLLRMSVHYLKQAVSLCMLSLFLLSMVNSLVAVLFLNTTSNLMRTNFASSVSLVVPVFILLIIYVSISLCLCSDDKQPHLK